MWHSEEDLIRDLAFLNDFGVQGDEKPYRILLSNGRGKKVKKKSTYSKTFIDPRTGEKIKIDDGILVNDNFNGCSKGRGRAIGHIVRAELQLQKQLRLARPLGSSNALVESYFRRNEPKEHIPNDENTFEESDNDKSVNKMESCSACQPPKNFNKVWQTVKATRSSSPQNNALVASLLDASKSKTDLCNTSDREQQKDTKLISQRDKRKVSADQAKEIDSESDILSVQKKDIVNEYHENFLSNNFELPAKNSCSEDKMKKSDIFLNSKEKIGSGNLESYEDFYKIDFSNSEGTGNDKKSCNCYSYDNVLPTDKNLANSNSEKVKISESELCSQEKTQMVSSLNKTKESNEKLKEEIFSFTNLQQCTQNIHDSYIPATTSKPFVFNPDDFPSLKKY